MTTPPRPSRAPWIAVGALLIGSTLCTLGVQGATLALAWMGDLSKMPFSARQALAFGLAHPLIIGALAGLLLLIRTQRPAAVVRTILLATLSAGFLLIPRLLFAPNQIYAAGLLRTGIALLAGGSLLAWARARGRVQPRPGGALPLSLLLAALFILPWLRYGALGDVLDTLFAGVQAIALAVLAAGLAANLLPLLAESSPNRRNNLLAGGFTLSVAFAAIAAAWGQMGYQALLTLILPIWGFVMAFAGVRERRFDAWSAVILVALTAFGPLAFADPKEVRLVSLVSGDTAVWLFRAVALNLLSGLFLLLLVFLPTAAEVARRLRWVWSGLALLAWAGAVAFWLLFGQPGFFGDDFFVVFTAQANLDRAAEIIDVEERRAWVYDTLVAQADDAQPYLLTWLDQRDIDYTRYYLVNGVEVRANAIRRWQIARRPEVDRILDSPRLRPLPRPPALEPGDPDPPAEQPWGVEAVRAPRVWSEFGITGEGVVIGHSDSGVDAAHPALAARYRGQNGAHDYNWFDPWTHSVAPWDGHGHGTHTLGTILGQEGVGVAPGATWFACANLVRNLGNPANYLDCMQFMLAPQPLDGDPLRDGRPDLAADISSNSWGCPPSFEGCDQQTLWQATAALRAAGIFFVVAAGNEGPACDSLQTPPGNYGNALTVGALGPDGNLADFSNRGPHTLSPDGSTHPDLIAPGVEVTSAWPGGGWNTAGGTSMAAPHVAGVAALMWSANPDLRGNVDLTEQILLQTAAPYTGLPDGCGDPGEFPDSGAGYGVVDAYAAVKRALELR